MIKIALPAQMREMDRRCIEDMGVPSMALMERAAYEVLREAETMLPEKGRAVVFCGGGNNGGDGMALCRMLTLRGYGAFCVLLADAKRLAGDALSQYEILRRMRLPVYALDDAAGHLCGADLIVDAIFGTGFHGKLPPEAERAVELINGSGLPVLSVDIPSGVDGATGHAEEAVKAQRTVTFEAYKIAHVLFPGHDFCGQVIVAEIGLPKDGLAELNCEVMQDADVKALLPQRGRNTHKGSYGRVVIIAGSKAMPGAAVLCARAAVRSGAGLVSLGVPESAHPFVAKRILEAMAHPLPDDCGMLCADSAEKAIDLAAGADALALGPGWGGHEGQTELMSKLLAAFEGKLVIDADALKALDTSGLSPRSVLTPHPGEMARMSGLSVAEITDAPLDIAREYAQRWNCVLLLKGASSVIASPDGRARVNLTGCAGMASGGSGDVLTGVITSLLAQGLEPFDAASVGAYIAGLAGESAARRYGERAMAAGDTASELCRVLTRL